MRIPRPDPSRRQSPPGFFSVSEAPVRILAILHEAAADPTAATQSRPAPGTGWILRESTDPSGGLRHAMLVPLQTIDGRNLVRVPLTKGLRPTVWRPDRTRPRPLPSGRSARFGENRVRDRFFPRFAAWQAAPFVFAA